MNTNLHIIVTNCVLTLGRGLMIRIDDQTCKIATQGTSEYQAILTVAAIYRHQLTQVGEGLCWIVDVDRLIDALLEILDTVLEIDSIDSLLFELIDLHFIC